MTARIDHPSRGLYAFFQEEDGGTGAVNFMAATMAISIPFGLMFYSIYDALCDAGRYASFLLGLF
jgi:hypothetical protein